MDLQRVDLSEVFTLLGDDINKKFYLKSGEEVSIVEIKPNSDDAFTCCKVGKEKTMLLHEATVYTNQLYIEDESSKKNLLIMRCHQMLIDSCNNMVAKLKLPPDSKLLEEWDKKSFLFPKATVAALLELEAHQYLGVGTDYEKEIRRKIHTIKHRVLTEGKGQ